MSNPEPLVFAYFKLPPDHQSFLRIREALWSVFVPQLEKLSSALETTQTIHSFPHATQVLHEARKAAADEVEKLWDFFNIVEGIAERYIEFLVYLSKNNLKKERYAYRTACLLAQAGTSDSEKAQQVMTNFREGIEGAISRIISTMAGNDEAMSSFIPESTKVLAEIATATDECNELLRECREDFTKLEKVDFDEESFLRNPSWDEHTLVLEKWRVFVKTVGSLCAGWSKLKNGIRGGEEDAPDTTTNTSPRDVRNPPISTAHSNSPMGLTGSALADPPSRSNKSKVPFWKKVLRRIIPCLG